MPSSDTTDLRHRILVATAALIATGGRDAATTRAVASAAKVQPPAIYRLFADKDALLEAVAEHVMTSYAAQKAQEAVDPDPMQALTEGWNRHVAFGLAHPDLFAILTGPRVGGTAGAQAGFAVLRARVRALALAGLLTTSEDRAMALLHSMATGIVLTLLSLPVEDRDPGLSQAALVAVLAAIMGAAPATFQGPAGVATSLNAMLDQTPVLTPGERLVLSEWLNRIAKA